ncbi:MAG: DNA double-strand break repair protein Mre11 [Methanonatronarchaeales archaeon]|nr:DNA double-strand break repair protein Mre11 [Methanonatronarchaeales archaeon]
MRFLHAADLHLGYRQYNLEARLEDFERAFDRVGRTAAGRSETLDEPVDFLLIAGDLFDDRSINARTFTGATEVLSKLRGAGLPVYVVEGNHDRAFHRDGMSWLEALDHRGLIELIRLQGDEGSGLRYLADFREVEVDGELARIYGIRYVGASTPKVAKAAAEEVGIIESREPADLTVAMMHFGIEGRGEGPGYSYSCLLPLRENVDYLALGHYHNAYEVEGWGYNPGSVEPTSVSEAGEDRGVYLYEDGDVELLDLGGRGFRRVFVDVSEAKSAEEAYGLVRRAAPDADGAIVDVVVNGELRFDRSRLSRKGVEEAIPGQPLHVMLKVNATRDELDVETRGIESRAAIERKVFEKMARDAGLPDGSASTMAEVKELALNRAPAEEVLGMVREVLGGGSGGGGETGSVEGGGSGPRDEGEGRVHPAGGEGDDEWNWRSAGAG